MSRKLRRQAQLFGVVPHERKDIVGLEPFAPLQEREFDHEGALHHRRAELCNQFGGRLCRAAGGDEIIRDDDPGIFGNAVNMNLQSVRAIFQLVTCAMGVVWQFSRLAHYGKAGAKLVRQRGAE